LVARAVRRRSSVLLVVLALMLGLTGSFTGASAELQGTAVAGIDQVFHPGRYEGGLIPSTEVPICKGTDDDPPECYRGPLLRVQSTSVGRRALEPTIAVNDKGHAFYAASWHDDSKAIILPVTHIRASFDGGLTWVDRTNRVPLHGEPNPPTNADPYVYVDQDTGRLFNPEAAGACLYINISDNEGQTWITNPIACGALNVDHQSFGHGPFPPALEPLKTIYPNVLYYCSNQVAFSMCHRSIDGGLAWTGTGTPAFHGYDTAAGGLCGGLAGHLDTDSKGRLFLPKGHCGGPWLAVSEDGGGTWRRTRVSPLSAASTHIAVATDAADNVYMLWWDSQYRLPWLAVSKDHGATFGPAMMVAPPGVMEVNFPELEAGDAGKVAITFPGGTQPSSAGARRPWNQYTIVTTNALDENPLFVSTTANPPTDPVHRGNCGPGRCGAMWDFIEITTSPLDGGFWASISDTCETTACRNGTSGVDNVSSGMGYAIRQIGGPRIRTVTPSTEG
jgi:hypothetical protein